MKFLRVVLMVAIQFLTFVGDSTITAGQFLLAFIKMLALTFFYVFRQIAIFLFLLFTSLQKFIRQVAKNATNKFKYRIPRKADIYIAPPLQAKTSALERSIIRKRGIVAWLKKLRFRMRRKKRKPIKLAQLPTSKKKKQKKTPFYPTPLLIKFRYFLAGTIFSLLLIFLPLLTIVFLQELPSPKTLASANSALTTKIYDRNGILLDQVYASQNRTLVTLKDIPLHLQQATVAIEDKDFYKHPGFDLSAIIRSAIVNFRGGEFQGGSTITQQLIKSSLLNPQATIQRKVKEVILAFWSERLYSKPQILEMYFNQIPYGGTAWGIQAASQLYFNKDVEDITLAESSFLAGIPQAPTRYSPYGTTPNAWKKRQHEVLDRMAKLGFITKQQAQKAKKETLVFQRQQIPLRAPHFVQYVKDVLVEKYGLSAVERGGLIVKTSLDSKTQEMAERIVSEEVAKNGHLNLTNGAALITNPKNGDVLAMVGSKDFSEPVFGNVNIATSIRQPGSSIKVVTYSQALMQGYTAATILDDSPVSYPIAGQGPYAPVNYDGGFHGRVPLRVALANSFNVPAVKTLNSIGIANMVSLAKQMGITTWGQPQEYGLSLTLGAAEVKMVDMAVVYGTLANQGVRIGLNPLLKVTDVKGDVMEEKKSIYGNRVLPEAIAFIMSNILSDNKAREMEFGANSPLVIPGKTVSVKTGTTDNKRDNWTFGFTPSYLVAVWVGNNDNSPMSQTLASGITGAAPIWHKIMQELIKDKPDEKPAQPTDVVTKTCYGKTEYFVLGTENMASCTQYLWPSITPTPRPI